MPALHAQTRRFRSTLRDVLVLKASLGLDALDLLEDGLVLFVAFISHSKASSAKLFAARIRLLVRFLRPVFA